jgi:hypothetical protein
MLCLIRFFVAQLLLARFLVARLVLARFPVQLGLTRELVQLARHTRASGTATRPRKREGLPSPLTLNAAKSLHPNLLAAMTVYRIADPLGILMNPWFNRPKPCALVNLAIRPVAIAVDQDLMLDGHELIREYMEDSLLQSEEVIPLDDDHPRRWGRRGPPGDLRRGE